MNWTRLKMNFTIDRESKNLVKWGNSWRRIFSISNNKSICRTAKHWMLAVIYLADKFHFVGKLAVLETKIILVDASVTIFWNYNFEIFRLKIKFRSFFRNFSWEKNGKKLFQTYLYHIDLLNFPVIMKSLNNQSIVAHIVLLPQQTKNTLKAFLELGQHLRTHASSSVACAAITLLMCASHKTLPKTGSTTKS